MSPLRVGILLDSWNVRHWEYRVLSDILQLDCADIKVAIVNAIEPDNHSAFVRRMITYRRYFLFSAFRKIDRMLFRSGYDPFQQIDARELLSAVKHIAITPRQTRHCDYFQDQDADDIEEYRLDVLVRFGFRILKGRALCLARYGIWSFHHGDNQTHRGGPAGVWEVLEGDPITGSMLQIVSNELDAGTVIYRSWSCTDPDSIHRNIANLYAKSSAFVSRALRQLAEEGETEFVRSRAELAEYRPYHNRLYRIPENREMVRLLRNHGSRLIRRKLRQRLTPDQWFLAYHFEAADTHEPFNPTESLHRLRSIYPPRGLSWADPFPVEAGGKFFVFFEEFSASDRRGSIAVIEISRDGTWSTAQSVLRREYHLSYPNVFSWQGGYFMIPETRERKRIELYECVDFPYQWRLHSVLIDGISAVDPTLLHDGERWWLFANTFEEHASASEELSLFWAESLYGPWNPHRRNPVKSDVRSSRPAGRIFRRNGALYRPAQDCSGTYGSAIVIHRIDALNAKEYREIEVAKILPKWARGLTGTHTINACRGLTVLDARRHLTQWHR